MNNQEKWSERLIDDVVGKIRENKIVPIIGPEAFYVADGEDVCSVMEYVTNLVINDPEYSFSDEEKNTPFLYCKGYRGMTELSKILRGDIRKALFDAYEMTREKVVLRKEVIDFLEFGDFPLVITTCNFDFLSDRIQYKGNKYHVCAYMEDPKTDINLEKDGPTIFHLFGLIKNADDPVVITENDFLVYLHSLNNDEFRPLQCKKYLEYKNILSIGCDIPDWTFRFLLYSLKEKNRKLPDGHGKLTFDGGFIVDDVDELDDNLSSFLSNISYCSDSFSDLFADSDIISFLNAVNNKITPVKRAKLFLSISSKEYEIGHKIKDKICDIFEVWIFDEHRDSQYWKTIEDAISKCDYFMPVISQRTYRILDRTAVSEDIDYSKDDSEGLITEWQMAKIHKEQNKKEDKYCVPFYVGETIQDRDELRKDFTEKLKQKDPKRNILWPLFYSGDGAEGYTKSSISELTAEKILNHINNSIENHE